MQTKIETPRATASDFDLSKTLADPDALIAEIAGLGRQIDDLIATEEGDDLLAELRDVISDINDRVTILEGMGA